MTREVVFALLNRGLRWVHNGGVVSEFGSFPSLAQRIVRINSPTGLAIASGVRRGPDHTTSTTTVPAT